MATTTPSRPPHLADAQRKLRSPLARLRGYIHTYVTLEGAALILLLLAAWFWVGLALDYLPFSLFHLDWLDVFPRSVRAIFLLLLAGVVGYLVYVRVRLYLSRFRDAALALLLERKFPKLLGDRLITAVELADPKQAAEYGYSMPMVEETIREAAARIDDVPVREVFDWGRLYRRGLLTLLGIVGFYLIVAGTVMAVSAIRHRGAWRGVHDLNDVLQTYIERNFLLWQSYWPVDTDLMVVAPNDNHRMSVESKLQLKVRANKTMVADRGAPRGWRPATWKDLKEHAEFVGGEAPRRDPPEDWLAPKSRPDLLTDNAVALWHSQLTVDDVEVRLRHFLVRPVAREGGGPVSWERSPSGRGDDWRPLLWQELRDQTGGSALPRVCPEVFPSRPDAAASLVAAAALGSTPGSTAAFLVSLPGENQLTFDEVVNQLPEVVQRQPAFEAAARDVRSLQARLEQLDALNGILERVARSATEAEQSRTLRQLDIPDVVDVDYWDNDTRTRLTLRKDPENPFQYVGEIDKLKEGDYTYRVSARDFTSPTRRFTVLGPPTLIELFSQERHPAYLYHRASSLVQKPDPKSGETDQDLPSLALAVGAWAVPGVRASWDEVELRGQRQALPPVNMTNYPGAVLTFEVPINSDVTLTGQASRPLKKVKLDPERAGRAYLVGEDRFEVVIENAREFSGQNLRIEFYDSDDIKGERRVLVRAHKDEAPRFVEMQPVKVRLTKQGTYLVTAGARIPFQGRVEDDNGLKEIRYSYKIFKKNAPTVVPVPQALAGLIPAGIELVRKADPDVLIRSGSATLPGLAEEQARAKALRFTPMELAQRLTDVRAGVRVRDAFVKHYDVKPYVLDKKNVETYDDKNDFFIAALGLKTPKGLQVPYRVVVTVEALDYNAEGDIGADGSAQPQVSATETFSFLVVDPDDLEREMDKEETDLFNKIDAVNKQLDSHDKQLPQERIDLGKLNVEDKKLVDGVRDRLDRLRSQLEDYHTAVHEVREAYDRIVEEIRLNDLPVKDKDLADLKEEVVQALHRLDASLKDRDKNDRGTDGEYFDRAGQSVQLYSDAVGKLQLLADEYDKAKTKAEASADKLKAVQQAKAEGKATQAEVDKAQTAADASANELMMLKKAKQEEFQNARTDPKPGADKLSADKAEADLKQLKDKVNALADALKKRAGFQKIKRRLAEFARLEGESTETINRRQKEVQEQLDKDP